jgi:hypothetical protein
MSNSFFSGCKIPTISEKIYNIIVDKFGIDKDDIAMIIKKEDNYWIVFDVDNEVVGSLTDEEVTDESK